MLYDKVVFASFVADVLVIMALIEMAIIMAKKPKSEKGKEKILPTWGATDLWPQVKKTLG